MHAKNNFWSYLCHSRQASLSVLPFRSHSPLKQRSSHPQILSPASIWIALSSLALILLLCHEFIYPLTIIHSPDSIKKGLASPSYHLKYKNSNLYCDKARSSQYLVSSKTNPKRTQCIFDIGLNTGQDTSAYLAAGARVVAVEANPTLLLNAHARFLDAQFDGHLVLVGVGLIGKNKSSNGNTRKKLTFWTNTVNDKFGSFEEYLGCRRDDGKVMPIGDHRYCKKIEVATRTCSDLIDEYGTPDYMKIDIEGLDRACLESLQDVQERRRPTYVSIENVWEYDIKLLASMGYKKFKAVNQAALQIDVKREDEGNSGPWGEAATDIITGQDWRSANQVLDSLPMPSSVIINGRTFKGWYDLHASK